MQTSAASCLNCGYFTVHTVLEDNKLNNSQITYLYF